MATDTAAGHERSRLCDLFLEVGPDAPTLCEGWDTLDLASHLFVRERRPIAALGLMGGPLSRLTERATERTKDKGYERLVEAVHNGPPLPLRPVDKLMNLHEYFVHHEDVRRAGEGWTRRDDPALDAALWKLLQRSARFLTRRVKGVGLELRWGDETIRARKGEPVAVLKGDPGELVLYLYGRRTVADVELDGPPEAQQAIEGTDLSA